MYENLWHDSSGADVLQVHTDRREDYSAGANKLPTYVLRVTSGREERVKVILSHQNNLLGTYDKIWIPSKVVYHRNNETEKKRTGEAFSLVRNHLFPGYLFIDAEDFISLYEKLITYRFDSWINLMGRQEGQRQIVTDEELAWIAKLSAEEPSRVFREGDKIRFTDDSPLSGFEGFVKVMDWRKHRVCVEIPFFDEGAKRIWIAADSVDVVE